MFTDVVIPMVLLVVLVAMAVSIGRLYSKDAGRVQAFRRLLVGSYVVLVAMIPATAIFMA